MPPPGQVTVKKPTGAPQANFLSRPRPANHTRNQILPNANLPNQTNIALLRLNAQRREENQNGTTNIPADFADTLVNRILNNAPNAQNVAQRQNFLGAGRNVAQNVTNAQMPPKPNRPAPPLPGRGLRPPVTNAPTNDAPTPQNLEPTNDVPTPQNVEPTNDAPTTQNVEQRRNVFEKDKKWTQNAQNVTQRPNYLGAGRHVTQNVTNAPTNDVPTTPATDAQNVTQTTPATQTTTPTTTNATETKGANAPEKSEWEVKQEQRLSSALRFATLDPAPYYQGIKRAEGNDGQLYDDLVSAMDNLYAAASHEKIADNVKGLILREYCQKAAAAARKALASEAYAKQPGAKYLKPYAAGMEEAAEYLASYQGIETFEESEGIGSAKGNVNALTIYQKKDALEGENAVKFFRPELNEIQQVHKKSGIDENAEDLHMVEREKAFYILSEFLGTNLAAPTREGKRVIDGKTQKGAVLDKASGRTADEYNYKYMGIDDYTETTSKGDKLTHHGGELLFTNKGETLDKRMAAKNTQLSKKEGAMKHVQGSLTQRELKTGKEGKAATIDALDPKFLRDLNRLHLLDILAGHPDRHFGNFLLDTDEKGNYKSMTAIDNDAVFGSKATYDKKPSLAQSAGKRWDNQTGIKAGMHMDKELAERIKEVAKNPAVLDSLFQNLLSKEEIEALKLRFQQLSDIIEQNEHLEEESRNNGNPRKLLLSQEDWDKDNMEDMVKDEMSQSMGARRGDNTTQESGNSYISRFMFVAQARDENERTSQAAWDSEAKKAEKAYPNLKLDNNTVRDKATMRAAVLTSGLDNVLKQINNLSLSDSDKAKAIQTAQEINSDIRKNIVLWGKFGNIMHRRKGVSPTAASVY